jgi:hypothetical protein
MVGADPVGTAYRGKLTLVPSRTRRAHPPAAAPLRRPPRRLPPADLACLVDQLRELHVAAGDPDVERMPADEHPRKAALWAARHAHRLTGPAAGRAAKLRIELWERLRNRLEEEIDREQSRAVRDARDVGERWADLAKPLGVKPGSASAAESKAGRLRAAELAAQPGVGTAGKSPGGWRDDCWRCAPPWCWTRRGKRTTGSTR